jgi:hypothetical protein
VIQTIEQIHKIVGLYKDKKIKNHEIIAKSRGFNLNQKWSNNFLIKKMYLGV